MITGDQLAIGKETGRRLGMGTNMYPSSTLLGLSKDESITGIAVDELIEKADGFAGVFPGILLYKSLVVSVKFNDSSTNKRMGLQSTSMKLSRSSKRESTFVE